MPRRPPGLVANQRKLLIAGLFCLLPLVIGDAKHQPDIERPQRVAATIITDNAPSSGASEVEVGNGGGDDDPRVVVRKAVGTSPHGNTDSHHYPSAATVETVETPSTKRKRTASYTEEQLPKHKYNSDDASALVPSALDPLAVASVRAPLSGNHAVSPSGFGGRMLRDWAVEDFALLATVDGDLIAVDRLTGRERWHTHLTKPVVETIHHRLNATFLSDQDFSPIDRYIWAVEPDPKGGIYILSPGTSGITRIDLSMKELVEKTPTKNPAMGVVYTGRKESVMVTLDPNTGAVREWYGSTDVEDDYQQYHSDSCARPDDFTNSDKCTTRGTLTLGRTDYVVVVRKIDGPVLATLKYSEWGPNNYDSDLHKQYLATQDGNYIVSDPKTARLFTYSSKEPRKRVDDNIVSKVLSSPIARVFDIARPKDAPSSSDPELLILAQPPLPSANDQEARLRNTSAFIGETKAGSWFALSGTLYPLVLQSGMAQCTMEGWWNHHRVQDMDHSRLSSVVTGLHTFSGPVRNPGLISERLTIDSGEEAEVENRSAPPALPAPPHEDPADFIDKVKELPQVAATSILDFVRNPTTFVVIFILLLIFQKDLRRGYARSSLRTKLFKAINKESFVDIADDQSADGSVAQEDEKEQPAPQADDPVKVVLTPSPNDREPEPSEIIKEAPQVEFDDKVDPTGEVKVDTGFLTPISEVVVEKDVVPTTEKPLEKEASPPASDPAVAKPEVSFAEEPQPAKKKKANHRGRRGGKAHKKKAGFKTEHSTSSMGDEPGEGTVEDAVKNAQKLGDTNRQIEPDIVTISDDVEEVSGPMLKMGNLTVNEDKQLGTGSNGTVVYAGTFDGRAVAVKRMLVQFNEIATQETKLLRESDDHENVIRYYTQYQRGPFLYIALQLCEASLADVIERSHQFPHLRQAGEQNLPKVLYQITEGISHLHSLRIVHRDLKPQNILVNLNKKGQICLLVSDFGLCKKLEGGQSSFGATTAHAAGTSGWRAPELLLDDDSRDPNRSLADVSSTHSGSGSLVSPELLPNRRVGRSIDIFSLGLVFFYVLTQGQHPFDCGDRYMREVNIRKGHYSLDRLDMLAEYAEEARNLVSMMLDPKPKARPTANEVMAHPFFWTAKRRLNFLVDVSDQFEHECRDPPSPALLKLESYASRTCGKDFTKQLPKEFIDSLGKQRKYTGDRLLDLLRALRNKKNHYEDMEPSLKRMVGTLPEGYLFFWTTRFPGLLLACWYAVWEIEWDQLDRFRDYYEPAYKVTA